MDRGVEKVKPVKYGLNLGLQIALVDAVKTKAEGTDEEMFGLVCQISKEQTQKKVSKEDQNIYELLITCDEKVYLEVQTILAQIESTVLTHRPLPRGWLMAGQLSH